jgi:hypothetical protein
MFDVHKIKAHTTESRRERDDVGEIKSYKALESFASLMLCFGVNNGMGKSCD